MRTSWGESATGLGAEAMAPGGSSAAGDTEGDAAAARCEGDVDGDALTLGSEEGDTDAAGLAVGGRDEVDGVGVRAATGMDPPLPGTRASPASHPNTEQPSPSPEPLLSAGISHAPPEEPELSSRQEVQSTM